jgi:hypothetical protein
MLSTIWTIVFYKYEENDSNCTKNSSSNSETSFWKSNLKNICSFLELIVSGFMFTVVIGHYLLPQHVKSLVSFKILIDSLSNSADAIDLFSYIDEPKITQDFRVVYAILCKYFFNLNVNLFPFDSNNL